MAHGHGDDHGHCTDNDGDEDGSHYDGNDWVMFEVAIIMSMMVMMAMMTMVLVMMIGDDGGGAMGVSMMAVI